MRMWPMAMPWPSAGTPPSFLVGLRGTSGTGLGTLHWLGGPIRHGAQPKHALCCMCTADALSAHHAALELLEASRSATAHAGLSVSAARPGLHAAHRMPTHTHTLCVHQTGVRACVRKHGCLPCWGV